MKVTSVQYQRRFITWQTLGLLLLAWGGFVLSCYLGVKQLWPLWLSISCNSLWAYLAYTVVHEASHHLLCKQPVINDTLGQIAMWLLTPTLGFYLYRKVHQYHHQYTNNSLHKDPDLWLSRGPGYVIFCKWLVMDVYYFYFFTRYIMPGSNRALLWGAIALMSSVLAVGGIFYLQWQQHFLLYVLLPTRLNNVFLSWTFAYLPHFPHKASANNNPEQTTRLLGGPQRLLSWILLGHNYHLVHHLNPKIPFFLYRRTWLRSIQK